ncbi:hypothetical protein ACFL9U_17850, partial [Thermodesulfobacteriota bacterium]
NRECEPEIFERLIQKNVKESFCFRAACRILSHLMDILRRVASGFAAGIGGWFIVLLSLTRLARTIKGLVEEVKKVQAFELESDASPFANPVG